MATTTTLSDFLMNIQKNLSEEERQISVQCEENMSLEAKLERILDRVRMNEQAKKGGALRSSNVLSRIKRVNFDVDKDGILKSITGCQISGKQSKFLDHSKLIGSNPLRGIRFF